jgi:bacterioferritin (cytochrome b1)
MEQTMLRGGRGAIAEEQAHADSIAERIVQLGGAPDLDPASLASRAHSEYVEGKSLVDMIREDLVAERIAIESYRENFAEQNLVQNSDQRAQAETSGSGSTSRAAAYAK